MKTFVVKSTKRIQRETLVTASSAKEARELVKSGEGNSFDAVTKVSNTVNAVTELRGRLRVE